MAEQTRKWQKWLLSILFFIAEEIIMTIIFIFLIVSIGFIIAYEKFYFIVPVIIIGALLFKFLNAINKRLDKD